MVAGELPQAIRTRQDDIAWIEFVRSDVQRIEGFSGANRTRDNVVQGVVPRFFRRDLAGVDQLLEYRIVPGQLREFTTPVEVGPAVPDACHIEAVAKRERTAQGCTHVGASLVGLCVFVYRGIGPYKRMPQAVFCR